MIDSSFLRGLGIGFAIAAPVGPVGLLVIRRALANGRLAAFVAGIGAATADTLYGAVAAYGLTVVSDFLVEHDGMIRLAGGLLLCVIGLRAARAVPLMPDEQRTGPGAWHDFAATTLITLTNPGTIVAFLGAFAVLGGIAAGTTAPHALVIGVFAGSALWWLILSTAAAALRHRLGPRWLKAINQASGALIALFGLAVLASLLV